MSKRIGRKLVLCCALLLIGFVRTARAEETCCGAAVSACDGLCENHMGQWTCTEAFYDYDCLCNDATVQHTADKSMCIPS